MDYQKIVTEMVQSLNGDMSREGFNKLASALGSGLSLMFGAFITDYDTMHNSLGGLVIAVQLDACKIHNDAHPQTRNPADLHDAPAEVQ